MAVLDIQIINASLKDIHGGIAASLDQATWISTAYLIAEIITIPLSPWLRRSSRQSGILLVNCALFLVFSMLCGLSTSLPMMIVFRAGQGFTGGVFIPTAMTIVLHCLPKRAADRAGAVRRYRDLRPGDRADARRLDHRYLFLALDLLHQSVARIVMISAVWYGLEGEPMQLDRLRRGDWPGIVCMAIGLGSLITVLEEGERKDWSATDDHATCRSLRRSSFRCSSFSNCGTKSRSSTCGCCAARLSPAPR